MAPGLDVVVDIIPTAIDGERANLWYWDGIDPGEDGFTADDVAFDHAPDGVTWNLFDEEFDLFTADGSDTVVPGALVQTTFSDTDPADGIDTGGLHNHLLMQIDDGDGNSTTPPPEGVYLVAMVIHADGYESSDPFFFVHRTFGLTDEPRDIATQWAKDNYDALVGETETLPGDFNADGVVDAADYTVWRNEVGSSYVPDDYLTWQDGYGASLEGDGAVAAASVPEPRRIGMIVASTLAVLLVRSQRRAREACRVPARYATAACLVLACVSGCSRTQEPGQMAASDVPYAGAVEVRQLVAASDQPTLLEFCVPVGCYRCDAMRPQINALAEKTSGQLSVRRVDINAERQLAVDWGVSVCPTYIVAAGGEELGRAAYPTSADLVAAIVPIPAAPHPEHD